MEVFKCNHEGCSTSKHRAKGYCCKHYKQFLKHGKTFTHTLRTFNEIIDKISYYELILTNNKMEEIGRAKIDKEDLDKVKIANRWTLDAEGYVYSSKEKVKMHRLLLNAQINQDVDHIKRGRKYRSDNRKINLRLATRSENNYNKEKQTNNTSGFKGVSWNKNSKKWVSYINFKKKRISLGSFDTIEEASKAYEKAANKLHKEFYYKQSSTTKRGKKP